MTTPDSGSPGAFYSDQPDLNLLKQTNSVLPGSTGGGIIETTKRAVIEALREGAGGSGLQMNNRTVPISLEYPLKEEEYPGIWVNFSVSKFNRAGLAHEYAVQDPDTHEWSQIQTWSFNGRVKLSIVGMKNKDRDQLVDKMIALLAFSRAPESWTTKKNQDTQQYRSFLTSLVSNEYVSITPLTDVLYSGGQGVDVGVPWQPDALAYTDEWSFDVHGQSMVTFSNDGAYTLSAVNVSPTMITSPPQDDTVTPASQPVGRGRSLWAPVPYLDIAGVRYGSL